MKPHRIRLAGPWEWQRAGSEVSPDGEPRKTCQLPFRRTDESAGNYEMVFFRGFHCPTGLGTTTTVAVAIEVENAAAQIWVNGEPSMAECDVPSSAGDIASTMWRCDVSSRLKPFNELKIKIASNHEQSQHGLISVCLEITD